MHYSIEDVQKLFPLEVLHQASLIQEQACVTPPSISRNGEIITALVKRQGKRDCRVYVRLESSGQDGLSIHGECSCQKAVNCEHIAAVLLQSLMNESDASLQAIGRLSALPLPDTNLGNESGRPVVLPQQILYQLFSDPQTNRALLLELCRVRLLKKGGFASRTAYRPGSVARVRPPSFLKPVDQALLKHLDAVGVDAYSGKFYLQGSASDLLLEEIVATGRCVLGDSDKILRRARDRSLNFGWQVDDEARQSPVFQALPEAQMVVMLATLWYFDVATAECGKLLTDLPHELLTELLEIEFIEPHAVDQMEATWIKRFPNISIPPLRRFIIEQREQHRPVPCLRFSSEEKQDSDQESSLVGMLRLSFDYAGIRLAGGQSSQVLSGERVVKVQRDSGFEQQCVARLLDAGLIGDQWWREEEIEECFSVSGDAKEWLTFQTEVLPDLQQQGWCVEYDQKFPHRLVSIEAWYGKIQPRQSHDWFDTSLGVQVEGERINLLPLLVDMIGEFSKLFRQHQSGTPLPENQMFIPLGSGRVISMSMSRVKNILSTLFEIYDDYPLDEEGRLSLSQIQLARLAELQADEAGSGSWVHWSGAEDERELVERLRGIEEIPPVDAPVGLSVHLRDYQRQGLAWLQFLHGHGLAGILADDMGLGKTIQTLAHLQLEKEQGRLDLPALVVAPTSLMVNWRREAARFTPGLKVLTLHGAKRHRDFRRVGEYDLVLTTYALLSRDQETLLNQQYHMLILDEAQVIKNPKTHTSRLVRQMDARHRLCLTGTPMENHLGELWSLFDFLLPGLLGSAKQFARVLQNPIEKQADEEASERLAKRVGPFMLRRTKQRVAQDLPPKTEIIQSVELNGAQRDLYESVRLSMHEKVRQAIMAQGVEHSHIIVLDALLKLRQVCCDPRLLKLESAEGIQDSAKLETLMAMLPEMIEEGRRILLFSQFTGMLKLIEASVKRVGIEYVKLTGHTRDRAIPVERFQQGCVPLFLISLKAGGVGLNLTAADTVIHYDPWWNPAVEQQASDRAHRIGQSNPVFVYKLITIGSIEEKIQSMQLQKQALADSLFNNQGGSQASWSESDLNALFEPLE